MRARALLVSTLFVVGARAEDKKEADVVVTGTRTPEKSQRATVKTDVVTREEAERRGATNVAEALQSQPGVQVNPGAYGFLGGVSAIQIQGFDRDRILVLEDGERVVGDTGGAVDLSKLPIADVSRIEIVTGPTSSLYGSSAIGGVVNIITAPPSAEGPSGRARLEGRSGPGFVALGNGAYRARRTWAGMDVNYTYQDSVSRLGGLPDTQVPAAERGMLGARGGFALSDRIDVRLRTRWFHDHEQGQRSTDYPTIGRFFVDLPAETNRYTLHAITSFDAGRGSSVRITAGQQFYENFTAEITRGSPQGDRHDRHQRMQSLEIVSTIADGPRTWVTGARFEAQHYRQELTKTEIASGMVLTSHGDEQTPLGITTAASYMQLGWKVGKATLLPGVRIESSSKYGSSVTPRLAAALGFGKLAIARISGGRGFRAPSGKELGFIFDHSFLGYRVLGNANLKAEESWGLNGDLTMTPERALVLRVGGFANWVTDLIDIDVASGTRVGSVTTYTYKNFGHARTMGLQARASLKLAEHFRAEVGYDYLYTRDDDSDQPLGARPAHTLTCSLDWKLPWKLELYGRWRSVSDAFVSAAADGSPEVRAPGFTLVDVRIARELWPRAQAFVGLLDAFDIHQDPGRIGDLRPPLGRVAYVGIRAEAPWEEE
jgi:outer membrane receptor for ferrienterochelin and colicins